jgi:hypothetical protein
MRISCAFPRRIPEKRINENFFLIGRIPVAMFAASGHVPDALIGLTPILNAMSNKRITLPLAACTLFLLGCGSEEEARKAAADAPGPSELVDKNAVVHGTAIKSVELTHPLNQDWVTKGKTTYEMKCLACHRLDEVRIVGPGWAGVTKKREPVWIMNMITNVDMMLETDEEAQKLLELCLVRMPNQNVSEQEARELLEFMRHNDGEQ